jgi:MoaA/NifB/PqqE/SkfB family radical SAM enzyme
MEAEMMFRAENISVLDLELTNRCNASCPMCARNHHGVGVNPRLTMADLDGAALERLGILPQIEKVNLCGNYGDPIINKDMIGIIQHLRGFNPEMSFLVHTNGGARTVAWWQELAQIPNLRVRFGIDGLADTNHLYRKGVVWAALERNVRAFIAAGGHAEWKFIIFKHNQHQVEAAQALATEIGFKRFTKVKTNRFKGEGFPVHNSEGIAYHLEEAVIDDASMIASNATRPVGTGRSRGGYDSIPHDSVTDWREKVSQEALGRQQPDVSCYAVHERQIYVNAYGEVYPCCQTAYVDGWGRSFDAPGAQMIEAIGNRDTINIRSRSLPEILGSPLFQRIVDGWRQQSIGEGRMAICSSVCGKVMKPSLYDHTDLG